MSATGVAISGLHCAASVPRTVQLIELCGRTTPPGPTRSAANTLLLYCPTVKSNCFGQVISDRDRRRLRISGVWLGWLDAALSTRESKGIEKRGLECGAAIYPGPLTREQLAPALA